MAEDGGGTANPYAPQTATNTDPAWLGDGQKVDVDLDGLGEYAKHMKTAQEDLMNRASHLSRLAQMPHEAWKGSVLGEAQYVRQLMATNAGELTRYLGNLTATLQNIGMAAQTVADIYRDTDGTSAASLDAVRFAFGDRNVPRPAGLPPGVGKTYWDHMSEQAMTNPPPAAGVDQWSAPVEQHGASPYQSTMVSYAANGQRREISTTHVPGTMTTIVTTTVYGPGDKVLSTSSERTSSYVSGTTVRSTTESSRDGKVTGTTEESTTYTGGEVTKETSTTKNPEGQQTGRTEQTVDGSGTTTVTYDGKDNETDRTVVGPETEGRETPGKPLAEQYSPHTAG